MCDDYDGPYDPWTHDYAPGDRVTAAEEPTRRGVVVAHGLTGLLAGMGSLTTEYIRVEWADAPEEAPPGFYQRPYLELRPARWAETDRDGGGVRCV